MKERQLISVIAWRQQFFHNKTLQSPLLKKSLQTLTKFEGCLQPHKTFWRNRYDYRDRQRSYSIAGKRKNCGHYSEIDEYVGRAWHDNRRT